MKPLHEFELTCVCASWIPKGVLNVPGRLEGQPPNSGAGFWHAQKLAPEGLSNFSRNLSLGLPEFQKARAHIISRIIYASFKLRDKQKTEIEDSFIYPPRHVPHQIIKLFKYITMKSVNLKVRSIQTRHHLIDNNWVDSQ